MIFVVQVVLALTLQATLRTFNCDQQMVIVLPNPMKK